ADIASGRIAEVRSRSMSCNCMTRTSQQECRGILELKKKSRKINRTKEQKFTGKVKNSLCSVWQFRGKIQIKTVEGYFTVKRMK
ncbi:MAG: hypothetical protein SO471_03030, partial [Anaerobutyricum hallii]